MMAVEWLLSKALVFATLPYNGALHHYTLGPIAQLVKEQDDYVRLRALLYKFRLRKEQELHFVQIASTMSAAAVIGGFSWPDVSNSYWLARLCWHCSFWLSVFSLLSSTQHRMIEQLPKDRHSPMSEPQLRLLLRIILTSQHHHQSDIESNKTNTKSAIHSNLFMIYFWQSSLMLMSYSWALFLIGYALYLLSPVINIDTWTIEQTTALVAAIFGIACLVQFSVLNSIFRAQPLRDILRSLDTTIYDAMQQTDLNEILPKQQSSDQSEVKAIEDESVIP